MAVMFVMVKVLVDLLQVKNVLKTILHSFQIWGSKPPNKTNEYEHERDSSSNVTTVLICRTESDRNCQDIQNLSHKQNGAPKTEIFWYVMHVNWKRVTSVSNDCSAFIFRVRVRNCLTLKMKALQSYKRLVTWHLIFIKTAAKTSNLAI